MRQEWASFNGGVWQKEINVRDFIQKNYTPYEGDESFLAGPTKATNDLWAQVMELTEEEHKKGGVLDMDTHIISTITSHGPGYLNKEKETIVGFQTDKPFKRRFSQTAVSVWRSKPARTTAIMWIRKL